MQLPTGTAGAYVLLRYYPNDAIPIYVGRSDTCLRRRLIRHPLRGLASHFLVAPTRNLEQAFAVESHWYHQYRSEGFPVMNRIHPASPAGTGRRCPFCPDGATARALDRAFPNPRTFDL